MDRAPNKLNNKAHLLRPGTAVCVNPQTPLRKMKCHVPDSMVRAVEPCREWWHQSSSPTFSEKWTKVLMKPRHPYSTLWVVLQTGAGWALLWTLEELAVVIRCIYQTATKILHQQIPWPSRHLQPAVLLTAFTGTAASNISGKTLHSILKLLRSLKPPYQGLGNALDEMRAALSNAEILMKYLWFQGAFCLQPLEISADQRKQETFCWDVCSWVGDFYQLPLYYSSLFLFAVWVWLSDTDPLCPHRPLPLLPLSGVSIVTVLTTVYICVCVHVCETFTINYY